MTLQIFIITIFTVIISARILFSKNYRIYYMLTAFFSIRLWVAILATIYYASGDVYMIEIQEYTTRSEFITFSVFLIAIIYIVLEFIAMRLIIKQYKSITITPCINIYNQLLPLAAIVFLVTNIYLSWEVYSSFLPESSFKVTFVEFTNFPYLYKILEPLSLFALIVIAYGLSSIKLSALKGKTLKIYIVYFIFILGFAFFSFRHIYINAKSPYLTLLLLYFIMPMYIFNQKYNIVFFKNTFSKYFALLSFLFLIGFSFYFNYGDSFLFKIVDRVLLEGQLLYSSLEYFDMHNVTDSFLLNIPGNGDDRAMVYLMEMFLPENRLNQFYNTGWQMSGAMPAYNFMFQDYWIGFLYWTLNWIFFIFLLVRGIKTFLMGQLARTFIYFNVSFLVGFFYLILGKNFLFSIRFWVLLVMLIFIELFMHYKNNNYISSSVKVN